MPFPAVPFAPPALETRVLTPVSSARTRMSRCESGSPAAMLSAREAKATYRPLAEIDGVTELPLAPAPAWPLARETSTVVPPAAEPWAPRALDATAAPARANAIPRHLEILPAMGRSYHPST